MREFSQKTCIQHNLKKTNNFHISQVLPLYQNRPTDFHSKSIIWCLFNENTGLKKYKSLKNSCDGVHILGTLQVKKINLFIGIS